MTFIDTVTAQSKPARLRPEYRHKGQEIAFRYRDVYFDVDVRNKLIEIVEMQVPRTKRGKGRGSRALDWLVAIAKTYNLRVICSPEPFGNIPMFTEKRLSEWYVRHGVQVYARP